MNDGHEQGGGRVPGPVRRWIPMLLGVGIGALAGFGLGRATLPETTGPSPEAAYDARPTRGPDDAPVTIVEYTDYQCPFCGRYHREVYPDLMKEYGERIRYAVRQFPLRNIHPQAEMASRAAVCAQRQGAFWPFHDLLFTDQKGGLSRDLVERHVGTLGLDLGEFTGCLDSQSSWDVVAGDFLEGISRGVRSTPSFWIEGRLLDGYQPLATFEQVLDSIFQGRNEGGAEPE